MVHPLDLWSIDGSNASLWLYSPAMDHWSIHAYMVHSWFYGPSMDLLSIQELSSIHGSVVHPKIWFIQQYGPSIPWFWSWPYGVSMDLCRIDISSIHGSMVHPWIYGPSMDLWSMHGSMIHRSSIDQSSIFWYGPSMTYIPSLDLWSMHGFMAMQGLSMHLRSIHGPTVHP